MNRTIIITGTDTEIGKTVFSAALTGALDGCYWKPVQAGLDDGSDRERVARLAGVGEERLLPEAYRLTTPCSPHQAADIDGVTIEAERLTIPECDRPLVVEGAGGALVPLTRSLTYADMFARWKAPAVIVARTALGTINHSLLTVEALRSRGVPLLGIAFVGDSNEETESVIAEIGNVRRLGRLPRLRSLTPETLRAAFTDHFNLGDFR
ncbi:dethiobiotin synthase [Stakelama marina]|uniref:ATP-dependent dethiobiotin synthetase BioD n=1 Tax=Stakelama marina TaxID=2826939 RepID=A0A8T4IDF2_9SPHN|nr:dethiobiotin synthase [Stakelama marina]MBR0552431.1 ATP-dependent dethiobiotin synthetase BioD [Stakelama marina]